jgi:hypothetical protein
MGFQPNKLLQMGQHLELLEEAQYCAKVGDRLPLQSGTTQT